MSAQTSLFDAPATSPFENAAVWIAMALSGPLVTALCVLAVALLGFLMLRGRLPIRAGLQVVTGSFLLFGASVVAQGLLSAAGQASAAATPTPSPVISPYVLVVPPPPPPSNYDPYAGATIRQDQRE